MEILIATLGTRGDVQPYIGLSQMLIAAGHSATIASSRAHQQLIEGFHIPFYCIDETPDTSAIQEVARRKGIAAIREGVRMLFDGMLHCHEKLLEGLKGIDLVIGHGWLGEVESEMARKRFIRVGISPTVAEKVRSEATTFAQKLRIDIERLALNRMIIKPYNDFRRTVNYGTTDLKRIYDKPLFLPISKVLLESSALWNDRTYQSSYWYASHAGYALPDDLLAVLSNGRRSVLLNFGSMTSGLKIDDGFIREFYNLAMELDYNLMWVGPHAFSAEYLESDRFVAVEEIPLSHLLPEVDVVFHHCGLGTTSEVIRSGCPSVPVPFVVDQHDWARRLVSTGAATEPLHPHQLSTGHVRRRLKSVFENEDYRVKARGVREKVLEEIEADETVTRIEILCGA